MGIVDKIRRLAQCLVLDPSDGEAARELVAWLQRSGAVSEPRLPVDVLPIRISPEHIEASSSLKTIAMVQNGDALISFADSQVIYGRTGPSDHLEVKIHLSVPAERTKVHRAKAEQITIVDEPLEEMINTSGRASPRTDYYSILYGKS